MTAITVIGSVNLDFVATAQALPAPGETVTGARLARHPGGKGANQALAARRLGAEVLLVGCVGADSLADEALALAWLEVAAGIEIESAIDYNQVAPDDLAAILALPQAEQRDWFTDLHRELNSCEYVE